MIQQLITRYLQWRERRLRKWCVKMAAKSMKTDKQFAILNCAESLLMFVKGKDIIPDL